MNKKRWALVVLCVLLILGYIKFFYKTYSVTVVPKSADYIIALDVKRITNTVIWNIITTPSQWKKISFSPGHKGAISWKDMVKLPDYVLAFHVSDQPANIWYTVAEIKDKDDFAKGLQQYQFEKLDSSTYASKQTGIQFFKHDDQLLVTNATVTSNNYLLQVANELFSQKKYIAKETLEKAVDAKSHLAIFIPANNFLQDAAVISGNFDKNKIEINCALSPNKQFRFTENNFSYSSGSLCTFGFTQPPVSVFNLLSTTGKENISKVLNTDMDSLFLQSNKNYSLDISSIKTRVDSAISYTYDEDFNKVEKSVVNTVEEPAFNFTITGDSISNIYNYWQHNNKLEFAEAGELFKPVPFVKSYCSKKTATALNITAANYQAAATDKMVNAVLFLNLLLTKIPNDLLRYLPDDIIKAIANIESAQVKINKEKEQLSLNAIFQKKNNDLPVIYW